VNPTYYSCTDQRFNHSAAEDAFIARLQAAGVPVVPGVKLANNWIFDGAVNGTKILVEYHGEYWHNRPEVRERDERKRVWADVEGYEIITVWEADDQQNPDGQVARIVTAHRAAQDAAEAAAQAKGDKGDTPRRRRTDYGDWRHEFLAALAESGIVLDACEAAGVSRKTAYQHRDEDTNFSLDWKFALQDAADRMLRKYRTRAEQQSDRAMEFFLRTRDPETYAEKAKVEVTGGDGADLFAAFGEAVKRIYGQREDSGREDGA
jgi:very-short-patch-repair endonuclease